MKFRSSWVLALAAAAAAALGGAAWFWIARPAQTPPSAALPVTIAVNPAYAGSCPVVAASERGFFKAEGLAVTLQPYDSGKLALDATLQGLTDLATVAELPVAFAAVDGKPVMVLASMFKAEQIDGIVGRKDRGITAPADLMRKRIGVQLGAGNHFMLDSFLRLNGLTARDVTLVDLPTHDLANALAQGAVDAIAAWEPHLESARSLMGTNGTVFSAERVYSALFLLAGTRERIQGQPHVMRGVVRAVVRGAKYCADEPVASAALLKLPRNLDTAWRAAQWRGYRFDLSLDQSLLLVLEDQSRWAIQNKLVTGNTLPNYLDHLHLDALMSVRPAAVTIIH